LITIQNVCSCGAPQVTSDGNFYCEGKNLEILQLDLKKVFLHGDLNKELYIEQPEGFKDANRPNDVFRLLKSVIYRLKPTPRQGTKNVISSLKPLDLSRAQRILASLFNNELTRFIR
jgi:hypothetical protein